MDSTEKLVVAGLIFFGWKMMQDEKKDEKKKPPPTPADKGLRETVGNVVHDVTDTIKNVLPGILAFVGNLGGGPGGGGVDTKGNVYEVQMPSDDEVTIY